MPTEYLVPALVILVAIVCVWAVIVAAFREGKRVGEASKSERFDGVDCRLSLGNTEWTVFYDTACGTTSSGRGLIEKSARVRFRQYGSRVIGEGSDDTGDRWSIEGSAQDRRLCYLYLDRHGNVDDLGSVLVEMSPTGVEMTGVRTAWSEDGDGVQIQRIRLERVSV